MHLKSKTKKKLNIRHIFSARLKRESLKKAWAYFLLFCLVFSQGFSYSAQTPLAKAEDFTPQSLPVLVQTYEPSNSLTVSSVNTSLVWENPDRAYLTQLSKDSASAQFSSANSAVLKVIAASTTEVTVSVGQALPIVPDSGATSSVLSAGVFEASSTPENISALQPELNHGQAEAFQQASQTPAENLLVPSPAIETSDFEAVAPSVQVYAGDVETAEALPDATGSADLQAVVSPVAENGKETSAQPVSDTEAQVGPSSEEVVPSSSPGVLEPVIGTTSPESLALPLETTSSASSTEVFIPLLDLFQEIPTASGSAVSNLTETPEPTTTPEDVFNTSSMPSLISPDLVSAPQLEYSGFNLAIQDPDLSTSTQPTNLKLRLLLASLPIVSGSLVLEYAVATSSFQGLSVLSLSSGTSNYIHNGYVETALPLALYHDMSSLKIRMTYQAEREDLNQNPGQVILYLDGLSVVATYPDSSWDEEDLAALKLPSIAPEQFAHLEFFGPLMELFMPSDLSVNPITVGSRLDVNTVLPLKLLPWGVSTATPPTRLGETVTYSGAFASTDLEYKLTDTVLKENIILKDKAHPAKFRYLVNFDGYDPVQVSPSVIVLYQKGHKGNRLFKRYTLSAPVMTDSQGQTSDKLVFRLKGNLLTLTPDAEFLKQAAYPVVVDPTVELNILNVSSFPVAGEYWTIDFTTLGQDNLLVTPGDQATIDDMQFSSLTCDGVSISSELQANGAVFSPNWTCDGLGQIKFLDKKTGHHHMVFSFGPATQDAYNGANVYTGVTGGAWETGSNWSLGTPPGPADDVVINTAVTVNVNASSTVSSLTVGVSGGGTASVLNFNYNAVGAPVTTLGDLVVYSGASVTHTGNSTSTPLGRINFSVGGNATVSGSITANGKGFDATKGPGAARLNSSAGGSYGGLGGPYGSCCAPADYTAATVTYGSITQPTDLGSGGGSSGSGDGGGAVQLAVTGTTTVTGSITANGADSGCCTGAGSGGSIYLTTSVLAGGGNITANGGYGSWSGGSGSTGGSGGGGRIAIYYTSDTSTTTVQNHGNYVSFFGRSVGGAGTIYKKAAAQTYGDLIVDNDNIQGATTDESLLASSTPISGTYDSITARDNAVFHLSTTTASATTVTIATNALYDVRAGTTLSYSTLTWGGGMLMDSGGTLAVLNQNQDLTIPSGSKLIQAIPSSSTSTLRTYNNVSVQGTLTHAYNAYATTGSPSLFRINWTINGDLSVTGTGTITALGRGYVSQQGPGVGTLSSGAGGSYGGYGSPYGSCCASADYTTQGPTYGSSTAPTDLGSGGASSGSGVGGGAIILNVTGTTTVSTSISADGAASGCCTGGGSGGSVYLTTVVLAGTGTISANGGGSGCSGASGSCGGTGGGGRVAVHYTTDASTIVYANHGNYASFFGRSIGGAGTIYKKNPSQTYGDLILDNDNMQGVTSDETLFGSSTPVSGVYDSITVRDTAAFFTNALSATATTITLSGNGMYDVRQNTTLNYTSLSWGGGIIMDSGGTFVVISQNQDLLIPTSSKLTLNVPGVTRTYNNLTINGLLSNSRNYFATSTTPTSSIYKLNWTINGNLVINSAGSINVDGRGYAGTYGPGAGSTYTASCCGGGGGAGYGGLGGSAGAAGGVTYGSYSQPTDLGSGGGSSGGTLGNAPGGGAIQMTVSGTTTLSGTISANGSAPLSGNDNGGGSGGSVYLTTAALSGAGAISTDGAGPHRYGASGAGGRIAVYYTTDNSTATYSNHGGGTIYGGAGTTYKKSTIQTYGDLIVDNNNLGSSDETVFGRTPLASVALDSLTIRNSGSVYLSAAQATATTLTLSGNGHYDVKSGTELTYSSLVWTGGILTDSDGVLQVLNQNQDLTIPTSSKLVFNVPGSTRTYNNFVISGILTHSRNTTATTGTPSLLLYKLDWQVNGNLTINTNGSINVDGRGYENASGPGAGVTYTLSCCGGGGGGGYGGIGASAGAAGGSFYGSLTAPTDLGSAGGSSGGTLGNAPGGGAVIFNVTGTSTLNGSISSKGVIRLYGNDDGGGSGGSVYLTTAGLSGSGTIYADGGPTDRYGGAGAGGRIALYYTADNSTLSYSNHGSNVGGNGGAGTTYRKGSAQTYGDLILDNNNYGGTTVANFGKTQVNTPLAFDNLTLKNSAFLHAVSAVVYNIVGGLTWSNAAGTSTYVTLQLAPSSSVATITQTGTMPINLPLVVDGVGTTSLATALSASSTLTVAAGVFYANNNTSTYSGLATISGGTYSASALPQNFLAGLTQTSGAFVGGSGTVNITGNLNLSGGNFNPSGITNITGNLNNSGGTFLATSGTVALTGLGQTVSGDNTFYNLTKTVAVADTLNFAASSTQTITNTMTLQGAASNLLALRSTASGTQWNINPQGSRLVAYLDVKDSNNVNALFINAYGSNSVDSGNNIKWAFFPATLTQSDFGFYQNIDSLQPTTPLALQNATTTIYSTSSPVRLRMNVLAPDNYLPSAYQAFKLQVSTSTSVDWVDVGSLPPNPAWWNTSWLNRRRIAFSNASSTANLLNFPVLVSLTANNIDYAKTKASGADIRFVDADGVTTLNYEIEKWDTSATSSLWVKVPQIDATSTTDFIWMYYNNSSATDNSTTTGVWDDSFKGVWHLKETTGTTIYDSTQYVNTGTKVSASEPVATSTSQIAGAQYFDGSNDYVYTADSFVNPTNVTLGTWFKTTTTSGRKLFGLESNQTGTGSASYDRHLYMGSNGRIYFGAYSGSIKTAMSTSVLNDGGWHYASGILDSGSSQIRLYIDGVLNSTTSLGAVGAYTGYFRMGSYKLNTWTNGGDGYYNGYLDEVRLSTTTRSADWILAEYKTGTNQYNTYFAEEGAGGAPDSLATWQFYNNPSVASGSVISAILLSTSLVRGTYEESNPTTLNPFDVPVGRAIEYDFAINPQSMLADTLYYFRLVQDSGLPLGVYSNYPALMYTYVPDPNPPTGFTATVDSATQISLAWSENGNTSTVQYLAENLTNSTNSGWISATATSFSGLACASTYSFTVKARNMIGVESSTVSQTATTPACGLPSGTGGSGVSSFSTRAFCLVVNGDAVTTNSSRVTLDISTDAQGVTQIELADNPLFVGSQKLPYAATISDWNLCGGNASCPSGVYKVYAKLYNAAGEVSPTISDDINYELIDVSSPVTVQFTTDAAFGLPSDANVAVGVSLSHATTVPVAVDYAHIGGTAVLGTDYQFTPGTLVIPSGQTTASINFRVASWTAGGTIVLGLANSTLASLGEITQFTYTILGNAPTSTEGEILLSSPGALSNNSSTSYTIWLSKAPTQDVTVAISTDGQTNAAPADLVFSPANWNIPQSVGLVQTINATSTSYGTVDHTAQSQDPAYRYVTKSLVVVLGSADSFCQQNPTDPTCSFCALNPTDPACAFCVLNPQDPSCTVSDPYCKLYPTDPACTDFCQVDPTDPACAYCALHPSDSQCQTQNCQTNPTDPACAFCQLYPQDAACTDTKTYCQLHPTDSKCQDPVCADPVSVACVCHVDPKDPACATYCQQNPASPDCQFCYINPTDPSCSSFCSLHPQNPTCQDNYCALNPADSKCVAAFCTLYPTDPLCQGSVCQQNPANPACTFCSLYPQDPACQQVDCTTNPNSPACAYCTLKPIDPTCLSYCQNHPADPACVVVEPYCNLHPEDPVCKSDECKTNPTTPACAYCVLHPEDTNCQSVSCQQNPTLQACQFCTLYPEDQKCKESVCTINPSDPACQTPYCELHPEDSACKTEACKANPNLPGCTFCALHPEDPVCAPSICQQNPTDPSCPPTGESFCKLHPDDQKCKKDFCILNPADSLCQPGYCESHPFDGACLTKETNKKLTELINTVTTVVDDSKDIAQQGLEKLPGNTSTAFSLAAFSSLVVAPVITAGRLSMPVYGLINGMTGAVDLWLWLIRLWYWLLGALGFRRRRKVWGTVYDSASKQPLDPVMVSLVDDRTKEVVDQSITDMAGRYGFLDRSGTFTIGAQKTNYQFPSKRIAGKSDEIYDNLYYGEAFTITNVGSSVVAPNIPMDPLAFDWNQMDKQRIIKLHPKLEHLKNLLFSLLFYSGFVFTALLVLVLPSALHIIFLAFYLVIILVRCLVPSQKLWGQVYMKDGTQLMSGMVLELVLPNLDVVFGRAKTGDNGRFFLKAQPGKYLLNVYSSSAPDRKLLGQFSVTVGKRGVVNGVFRI